MRLFLLVFAYAILASRAVPAWADERPAPQPVAVAGEARLIYKPGPGEPAVQGDAVVIERAPKVTGEAPTPLRLLVYTLKSEGRWLRVVAPTT